jgi:hypothetical protein
VFRSQFGLCLQTFGGSKPAGLGGDRDCTDMTVHKGLAKLFERSGGGNCEAISDGA